LINIEETNICGAYVIKPLIYEDNRGAFMENWNLRLFNKVLGLNISFVQQNHSKSHANVLRGLHYQHEKPQGKLVRVLAGAVRDVIVDIRKSSPTYGSYFVAELNSETNSQLWIPEGLAHGFYVVSETAEFCYHTTDYYNPGDEYTIKWDDQELNIDWKLNDQKPLLSDKDILGLDFMEAPHFD